MKITLHLQPITNHSAPGFRLPLVLLLLWHIRHVFTSMPTTTTTKNSYHKQRGMERLRDIYIYLMRIIALFINAEHTYTHSHCARERDRAHDDLQQELRLAPSFALC